MLSNLALKNWLATLPDDAQVGVDEGGLNLVVFGDGEYYLELGGLPLPDDDA